MTTRRMLTVRETFCTFSRPFYVPGSHSPNGIYCHVCVTVASSWKGYNKLGVTMKGSVMLLVDVTRIVDKNAQKQMESYEQLGYLFFFI